MGRTVSALLRIPKGCTIDAGVERLSFVSGLKITVLIPASQNLFLSDIHEELGTRQLLRECSGWNNFFWKKNSHLLVSVLLNQSYLGTQKMIRNRRQMGTRMSTLGGPLGSKLDGMCIGNFGPRPTQPRGASH